MKQIYKTLMYTGAAILIIVVLYLSTFLFFGPYLNNKKAAACVEEITDAQLPESIEIIETASYCGNVAGSENNLDIWAGVLARSELPYEQILALFPEYAVIMQLELDEEGRITTSIDQYMDFSKLKDLEDKSNLYIIGNYYRPRINLDIRGH